MKLVFKSLLVIAILGVIAAVGVLLYIGYDQTVYYAAKVTGSLYRLEKVKGLFSPNAFKGLIAVLAIVLLVLAVVLKYSGTIYSLFARFISKTGAALRARFNNDWTDPVFLCLLVVPVSAYIYYALKIPVDWDEAYTYIKFTSRSVFSCISYYPAPNNHILFSVLTSIFLHLPFPDLICIRIPSILIGILCLLFLFSFTKEFYNKYIAYIAVAVYSVFRMTLCYSFLSRGYGLQCLCFILMAYSVFKIISVPERKLYWIYYSISAIMGLYTMPSFLYPFTIGNLFLLITLRKSARYYFVSSFSICIVTLILYTPIILFNGLGALTHNEFVVPIPRSEVISRLAPFFYNVPWKLTHLPSYLILIIICIGTFIQFRNYKGATRWYFLLFLVVSPLLLIIHSVIPYERTFEYFNVIFAIFTGLILYEALSRAKAKQYLYTGFIVWQLLIVYKFDQVIYKDTWYLVDAQKALPTLRPGRNFFLCTNLFDLFLGYDLKVRKVTDANIKFKKGYLTNMDSIIDHKYDFYVIDTDSDRTVIAKPIYKNNYVTIYK
jgi:hypothetical protein